MKKMTVFRRLPRLPISHVTVLNKIIIIQHSVDSSIPLILTWFSYHNHNRMSETSMHNNAPNFSNQWRNQCKYIGLSWLRNHSFMFSPTSSAIRTVPLFITLIRRTIGKVYGKQKFVQNRKEMKPKKSSVFDVPIAIVLSSAHVIVNIYFFYLNLNIPI